MLSNRANNFLSTLKRVPGLSASEVEKIIKSQGYPCFDAWLDFQDRFAGYVEEFGGEAAVWGLVHEEPYWLPKKKAEIESEPDGKTWYISCADAHPSYSYQLENNGEFLGTPSESFDIYVERKSVAWHFNSNCEAELIKKPELSDPSFQKVFDLEIKKDLVPEASDKFSKYYMNDFYFLIEDCKSGKFRRAYRAKRS
ncbi:MAG: hypothetical protein OEZ47_06965 [Gammaproteobacteria bacterium]|nr:hypothetical protein [Gammaproteobacteria bacterium]